MYTIGQASARTGVSVPLLRAWERRYGVPSPARTSSRYRLYDEDSIERIRQMHALVTSGWSASQAARAVLERRGLAATGAVDRPSSADAAAGGEAVVASRAAGAPAAVDDAGIHDLPDLMARFVDAASRLDEGSLELVLGDAFAALGVDAALDAFVLPAMAAIGAAWSRGELDVAAEHAASNAVMRRLAALYEASADGRGVPAVIVGLPPGGRHELGALAFAVACRRAGLATLYLGADVPVASWLSAVGEHPGAAVVLAAVSAAEASAAADVLAALDAVRPDLVVGVGGEHAAEAAGDPRRVLAASLPAAARGLRARLGRG